MIRMIQSRDAAHARAYFSSALAKGDYYLSDQELPGLWQGRLAERLGLRGEATREQFAALSENQHPGTGAPLTPRRNAERTVGYDINFHCPKSVSVVHALSSDDHILAAFRESVTETMKMIEADSQTRVRTGGVYEDRASGELVWAQFIHQTARPVEGHRPDPHLHAHAYVFNAAWDPAEQRVKAGQFREIKRDMPYYQSCFQKSLADKLTALGYSIRQTERSFEIEGVPQRVIDHFSKRTNQIGRIAQEKGITDPGELSELGARTRARKQQGATMADLRQEWRRQIVALGPEPEGDAFVRFAPAKETPNRTVRQPFNTAALDPAQMAPAGSAPAREAPGLTARQCLDYALLHCFERHSVMDGRRILETALHRAVGVPGVSAEDITRQFESDTRIIHVKEKGRTLCTTKEVLSEERRMVELARAGQGKMIPLYQTAPEVALTGPQQRRAVEHILTTTHRVSIVRGVAGAGKTTLMKEAAAKIEEAGKTVTAVAPTALASRGVLREEGFREATTVAALLTDTTMQEKLKGQVLWVDEAGLLGTQDMTRLLELTTRMNARLILSGDTRQHASVVRGDALRILNTVAGIQTAEVSTIYRQADAPYRDAVKDLSNGDVAQAFGKLDRLGFIKDMHDSSLVKDYVDVLARGKSALVVSPTHAQGDEITAEIRTELRKRSMLGKKEIDVTQLKNLSLTQAEKSNPREFSPGQVIQFTQNAPGFRRGSQWTVSRVTATEVEVTNGAGGTRPLPTHMSGRYEVFEKATIPLSKGDRVRITHNGFDADKKRLNNGDVLTVVSVSMRGAIILRNERSQATYSIDKSFGHLAHGHCVTSHAAQGKNVDEVFIYQPASTFPATDAKQFYVSVSRARDRAHIYTDDREDLLHHASDLRERQSAIELTAKDRHRDTIFRQQQAEQSTRRTRERNGHEPEF